MSRSSGSEKERPELEIVVHPIRRIDIFEVTEEELDSLEVAFAQESRAFAFSALTVWFGLAYRDAKRKRPELIKRIKERKRLP